MEYDNIYIDNDDDITSVVDKVAKSKKKLIKLVPPKRVGFLQSAVSMKLIKRTARKSNKDVVVVTVDPVLSNLAAMAGVMVARGLKAEPELLEIDELEGADEPDEIDGENYADEDEKKNPKDKDIEVELRRIDSELDDEDEEHDGKKNNKVKKAPNFTKFRKWLFLGGGLAVLLVGFLVWALVFAPQATITIHAKTTSEKIQKNVTLGDSLATNSTAGTIKTTTKQEKREESVEVEATGQRDIGEHATGTVALSSTDSYTCSNGILSGTVVTLDGKQFDMTAGANFVPASGPGEPCAASGVSIRARVNGESYNITDGSGSVSGYLASATGSTSGGTSKIAKVVTEVDVRKAQEKIKGEDAENIKSDMTVKFGDDYVVIATSFKSQIADPAVAPAIDEVTESGRFKLTMTTTYSLMALSKEEIKNFTKKILEEKAESLGGQKIYDYGEEKANLNSFARPESGETATGVLVTSGKLGPVIDPDKVVKDMAGKKTMEVKAILEKKNGVTRVDVDMFFTSTVPTDPNKVKVSFESEK